MYVGCLSEIGAGSRIVGKPETIRQAGIASDWRVIQDLSGSG